MCSFGQQWICSYAVMVNNGYAYVLEWSLVDMLMCRGGQLWICSGAVVVNGGYAHVEQWSMEGYAHVQQLSLNSGYIHVQE